MQRILIDTSPACINSQYLNEGVLKIIREMQVKLIRRQYFTVTRITFKTEDKCWRAPGEMEAFICCWWECKMVQHLWGTVWKLLRKWKSYQMTQEFCIYPRKLKNIHSKTDAWYVYSSIFYFPQSGSRVDVHSLMNEWTKCASWWNIIQPHKRMKFWYILSQGWTLKTSCSVKEGCHKKTIVWFHACKMSKTDKFIMTENRLTVGSGRGEWELTDSGNSFLWGR